MVYNPLQRKQIEEVKMSRFAVVLLVMLLPLQASAVTAKDIMKRSQAAFLYPGRDFKARVVMKLIDKSGRERIRELTMLRKNYGAPGGEQKYFIYFFRPADVKGMTFMVYKYPEKDDDRWLYVPAIDMVRRIAARDKRSSFVGSDFTYEDISGRDIEDDNHELLREEPLDGRDCFVIRSTPKGEDGDYLYRLSWIEKGSFLPLKEEYYDLKGQLHRVFTADEVKEIEGFPTVTERTMRNVRSGHRTEVRFVTVDYDIGIKDSLFSERFLRRPPKKWIR